MLTSAMRKGVALAVIAAAAYAQQAWADEAGCQQYAQRLRLAISGGKLVLPAPQDDSQRSRFLGELAKRQMPDGVLPSVGGQGAIVEAGQGPDGLLRTYYLNCSSGMLFLSKRGGETTYWQGPYKMEQVLPATAWWKEQQASQF
jgi:hypothetical protein